MIIRIKLIHPYFEKLTTGLRYFSFFFFFFFSTCLSFIMNKLDLETVSTVDNNSWNV